ncbi:MAG: thiol:disulfide interchange protein DsbA/DsbL [Brachymonas sp.]|nr:thiol:disulfide interchange protein DsbA/DsbL [Brachymonas sp.]
MTAPMKRRDFARTLAAGSGLLLLGGGALTACTKQDAAAPGGAASGAALVPVAGIDYAVLKNPLPTDAPAGKASMTEFFGYWCPHCNTFAPEVEAWRKQAPANIAFDMVPVNFGSPGHEPLQRLYYALRDLGKLDDLHLRVYHALHVAKEPLVSSDAIIAWAGKQPELKDVDFASAYNSFSMDANLKKANQLIEGYQVNGVPSFGVAGKYFCDGSMAKSLSRALQIAAHLAQQEAKG